MLTPETLIKALADETRLRCVMLLVAETELCVCEFGHALEESQPKISRHLAALRKAGLVQDRRAGQWVYYHLHPELPTWSSFVLHAIAQGAQGTLPYEGDLQRLHTMQDRPGRCRNMTCLNHDAQDKEDRRRDD
jgi:ArsR family transcriptional regulator